MPCGFSRSFALSLSRTLTLVLKTRHDGHGVTYRSLADLRAGGFQLRSAQLGRMGRRRCHYAASSRTAQLRAFFTICPAQYGQVSTVQPRRGPEGSLLSRARVRGLAVLRRPSRRSPAASQLPHIPTTQRTRPLEDEQHRSLCIFLYYTFMLSYFGAFCTLVLCTRVKLPSRQQSHCPIILDEDPAGTVDHSNAGREQQLAFLNGHRQRWGRRLKGVYRLFKQPC